MGAGELAVSCVLLPPPILGWSRKFGGRNTMLRKHFRIRRIVIGLAFAALAAPTAATAAGTFVDGGPVPVSKATTSPQIRTEHSASTITPLQADGLRWQAMARIYERQQANTATSIYEDAPGTGGYAPVTHDQIKNALANSGLDADSQTSIYNKLAPRAHASPASNSFDWRDAGIGASSAFGVALLLLIAVAYLRRNQHAGLTRA
jgi:hypothetical protein